MDKGKIVYSSTLPLNNIEVISMCRVILATVLGVGRVFAEVSKENPLKAIYR